MLKDRLWTIAKKRASNLGYTFASGCEHDFQQKLGHAVQTIDWAGKSSDVDTIREAIRNTIELVDTMVSQAIAENLDELQENTLWDSLKKLCPIFPFC